MNKLRNLTPQARRWFHLRNFRTTVSAGINKEIPTAVVIKLPEQQQLSGCYSAFLENRRNFSTAKNEQSDTTFQESPLDSVTYERVCTETLDSLCDLFEELLENAIHLSGTDVSYSDGVLTVNLGKKYGTYVINRQTPNKQIWLSSPTSGPKRYDFVGPKTAETGRWIYKHNNESMHELLQRELKLILKDENFDFLSLPYGS